MRSMLLAFLLFLMTCTTARAGTAAPANAVQATAREQIEQVVARFQAAVVHKDGATLKQLFLPKDASWIAVLSEPSYRAMHAAHPGAPRFRPGSAAEFTGMVVGTPARMEERFSNVRIETDGAVASVYFEFVFLLDGKPNNRGSEAWQLINTGSGWKINALVYSVTLDPAHPQ